MLTRRSAAALLSACDTPAAAQAIAAMLGFAGDALPVGATLREHLALDPWCTGAVVVPGAGALRALVLHAADGAPADAAAARLATSVARRAPHGLWLLLTVQRAPARLLIAAPTTAPGRVAMLAVDRDHVVDSDAETLVSLAAAHSAGGHDLLVHRRWVDLLGRESLNRRFYRSLEQRVAELARDAAGTPDEAARAEVALLCSSRLLFLAFLQAKGWLDRDRAFLPRIYDDCMLDGGGFHRRVLRPLFFGTLNTPRSRRAPAARAFGAVPFLNGGLFAPVRAERGRDAPRLGDEALGRFVHDLLGHYRFTAREEGLSGTEAAVDPAMLGRAFESLMAGPERRASGTFYTPPEIAGRLTESALTGALRGNLGGRTTDAVAALAGDSPPPAAEREHVLEAIDGITVLDPACGSGGLLVGALEQLARWRVLSGDLRPLDAVRRELLARAIFGVDRDRTAVWLCELRLWLAVAVECSEDDPLRVLPLPNLDRNIRVGDALLAPVGHPATQARGAHSDRGGAARGVSALRERYARASGARKHSVARLLDRAERTAALAAVDVELERLAAQRRDIVAARRSRDLFGARVAMQRLDRAAVRLRDETAARRRERRQLVGGGGLPFRYDTHFADVMTQGGFTVIVGNPPWVRLHRIAPQERVLLRDRFAVLRHAAWAAGADAGGAGAGFGGQADLAALFVERSLDLLRPGGVLALLVPVKLWTALAGGGVRHLLPDRATVERLEDLSEAPELFDAVTYPSLLVATRRGVAGSCAEATKARREVAASGAEPTLPASAPAPARDTDVVVHRGPAVARWSASVTSLAFDGSDGSPWLLLPPAVRCGFDRIRAAGRPLADVAGGRPMLGVKCGVNDAFLVSAHFPAEAANSPFGICVPAAAPAAPFESAVPARAAAARLEAGSAASSEGRHVAILDRSGRTGCVSEAHLRPVIRGEQVCAWHTPPDDERIVWPHDADGPLRVLPADVAAWLAPHRARLAARTDVRHASRWWALHRVEAARQQLPRVVWADLARVPRASWLPAGDRTVPLNTCYVLRCPADEDAQALVALLNGPLAAAWLRSIAEPARGGYRRLFAWTMALLPVPSNWARARSILAPIAQRAVRTPSALPSDAELLDAALAAFRIRRRDVEALLEWQAMATG